MDFERSASKTSKKVLKKFLTNEKQSDIINKLLKSGSELRKVLKMLENSRLYLVN